MLKPYKKIIWLRISLGILFLWFGGLKFLPNLSPAEDIVGQTFLALSFGYIKPNVSIPFIAVWECCIAIGFFTRRYLRWVMVLFYLHILGTFFPLFIFPHETWKIAPFVPTLLGQYIIKNIVLLAAGLVIGNAEQPKN